MVSFIPMNVIKFRIPNTKHIIKGGKCETFKGVNVVAIDGECREMRRENKKVEAMPTCYCPTFVLPALSSHFSVLSKFCLYHEHPFAFSPAMLVMPFCPFWSWFCPFWSAIGDKTRRLCLMAILRLGRNTVSVALPVRN